MHKIEERNSSMQTSSATMYRHTFFVHHAICFFVAFFCQSKLWHAGVSWNKLNSFQKFRYKKRQRIHTICTCKKFNQHNTNKFNLAAMRRSVSRRCTIGQLRHSVCMWFDSFHVQNLVQFLPKKKQNGQPILLCLILQTHRLLWIYKNAQHWRIKFTSAVFFFVFMKVHMFGDYNRANWCPSVG